MNDAHPTTSAPAVPVGDPGETAGVPSDNTTMTAVLEHYETAGWLAQFVVDDDDGAVRCTECSAVSAPAATAVHSVRRLEGASDPADMAGVLAITCRHCGARGTIVLAYGPHASPGEARLWTQFSDRRDDDRAPASMAPGEDEQPEPTTR